MWTIKNKIKNVNCKVLLENIKRFTVECNMFKDMFNSNRKHNFPLMGKEQLTMILQTI